MNVGTNGGSAYTRPGTVPARSDTVLVTSYGYDSAGRVEFVTDPRALVSRTQYDLMGRATKTIENFVDGVVSDGDDKTTVYAYGVAGMTSLTSLVTGGGGQTTEYVYGVSPSTGSTVTSNDIVGATKWPDPTTGTASSTEQETTTVNALGQTLTATDRNGNVHTLTYDVLGRVVSDAVTTLGTGVNGAVRRVEYAFDAQGNQFLVTSYDAASDGAVVNQAKRDFNGLGQLINEWQQHGGAVTGISPKVQYAYTFMAGGANHSRLTKVTYPSGYELNYHYGTGLDANISRLSSISDATGVLEGYQYLGLGTVVTRSHPQSGVDQTYVLKVPEPYGDAGDIYAGLDRFGRVVDQRWTTSGGAASVREQHSYDRDSNRLTRTNLVNGTFSEAYQYDELYQLVSFDRNSGDRAIDWDYDALGNFQGIDVDGVTETRTQNAQNEIGELVYDANGNTIVDDFGQQLVYDAWNRLVKVSDNTSVLLQTINYDGLGRRITSSDGITTRGYYYGMESQVLEETVGGTIDRRYVWSPVYVDALIVRQRASTTPGVLDERLWAVQDVNWNVVALLNDAGVVVERNAYDPYGAVTVLNSDWTVRVGGTQYAWNVLFQGKQYEGVIGLYYFNARWYSPTQQRFTTIDPILYESGDVMLYRFVGNSPGMGVDPWGMQNEFPRSGTYPGVA